MFQWVEQWNKLPLILLTINFDFVYTTWICVEPLELKRHTKHKHMCEKNCDMWADIDTQNQIVTKVPTIQAHRLVCKSKNPTTDSAF